MLVRMTRLGLAMPSVSCRAPTPMASMDTSTPTAQVDADDDGAHQPETRGNARKIHPQQGPELSCEVHVAAIARQRIDDRKPRGPQRPAPQR